MTISANTVAAKNSNANTTGTLTHDTTAAAGANGALLLIVISLASVAVDITDLTEGGASVNSWTLLFTTPVSLSWTMRVWICQDPNTNGSHTFKIDKDGAYPALAIEAHQFPDGPFEIASNGYRSRVFACPAARGEGR